MDAKRKEDAASSAPDCAGRNGAHTPGPWEVGENSDYEDVWFAPIYARCTRHPEFDLDVGRAVAWVIDVDEENTPVSANARLIAAAPDMLAALKRLVKTNPQPIPRDYEQARDAIAKAEGRSW